jgi:hypothetical protein
MGSIRICQRHGALLRRWRLRRYGTVVAEINALRKQSQGKRSGESFEAYARKKAGPATASEHLRVTYADVAVLEEESASA